MAASEVAEQTHPSLSSGKARPKARVGVFAPAMQQHFSGGCSLAASQALSQANVFDPAP